ncbi:jg20184 [Pararge aegeria aegeria]|uniref:Jg20184 protein n=1 Tax=Pararge aegeria aegeria TaxID=348720 RepID=A0A8S4S8J1_9NEOP|nr:jg20184 [Pararge aegeria aegeria]
MVAPNWLLDQAAWSGYLVRLLRQAAWSGCLVRLLGQAAWSGCLDRLLTGNHALQTGTSMDELYNKTLY